MATDQASQQWLEELRQSPEYEAKRLTIQLIEQCEARREELGYNYAELARRMGVTRAYAGKLLGGTQNSTVTSLVKLARALGCSLSIDLACGAGHPAGTAASGSAASRRLLVTASKPNGRAYR